ncbi:MAG: hypothetical protein HUJ90_04805, partial [Bacteroidales bacterium]|nr:hypothetical protein [Bacteroidales bacterium]
MSSLITAVELSTSKVSVAVGKREQQGVVIVAYETEPTKGVKRGEVVNIQQVTTALNSALARASEKAGEEITEVTLCISSPFMRSEEVKISRVRRHPDDPVETKEIAELRAEAIKSRSGEKEKVYDAIAQFFDIDDHIGVPLEDIVGMQGQNLDGYYKVVIGSAASYNSRIETVKKCGLSIRRTIVSAIGAARGCIKENEAENGVVLLDIGAGLTELVIIKDKVIKEVAVIPFGGECITNDIKSISCVTRDVAELLKVRYGSCIEEGIKDNKKLVIRGKGGSEDIEVP